jgi:hypothetical protein
MDSKITEDEATQAMNAAYSSATMNSHTKQKKEDYEKRVLRADKTFCKDCLHYASNMCGDQMCYGSLNSIGNPRQCSKIKTQLCKKGQLFIVRGEGETYMNSANYIK